MFYLYLHTLALVIVMRQSIWNKQVEFPKFPALEGDIQTHVLIIGGGLAGLLCADQLEKQGVETVIIEADKVCRGVTANTTAKITSQHGLIYDKLIREFGTETARVYWEANDSALQKVWDLAEGIPCDLERKDHYLYVLSSTGQLEKEMDALRNLNIPHDFASDLKLPFSTAGGIRFSNQAQFHPLKFAEKIAEGKKIYENTRALDLEGNVVITNRGKIRAKKIIVATHFPVFNKHGSFFLKMYQQRSYVMALENAQQVAGMYLDASGEGYSFRNQGNLLLLGGGSHRTGKKGTGWLTLEDLKKRSYPQAREICRWATQDCMTLDGMPYIGYYSKQTPNVYVATGFNKWGMTSSMLSAMILSDLVQGRENVYAPYFSPQRTMLRPQLLCNGFESAMNLLTPTKPRCTHLGCALKWNPWEHSWDCPCHGSRYTEDGKLINDPAKKDLSE